MDAGSTYASFLSWLRDRGPWLAAIVVAMILVPWACRALALRVVRLLGRGGPGGNEPGREARARTLVDVLHHSATVAIAVLGLLMLLDGLGVPVAPLLGGAVVLGLTGALGAQRLVRDLISGFMILAENQYKLDDFVQIGDVSGRVERFTLRVTALRSLDGSVHFIPNGEIASVTNLTYGWSQAMLAVGVSYREDVDRVMQAIVELGRELRADPEYGPLILDDLTMLGIKDFSERAVVVEFFLKTRPLQQWAVRREMLRRVKKRFDELGIEIPSSPRVLYKLHEPSIAREPGEVSGPPESTPGSTP
jgi:small conductance mechanosensitive channel